jgi:hypothetical protein
VRNGLREQGSCCLMPAGIILNTRDHQKPYRNLL